MPDVELLALTQAQRRTLLELIERREAILALNFDVTEWRELQSLKQAVEGE